jgi:DNA-binding GntR family transcriptional regulator
MIPPPTDLDYNAGELADMSASPRSQDTTVNSDFATFSGPAADQTAVAYRSIRRMIFDGGLPPGHHTSHRTLAEQLGLGRSPVRDAIMQLEAEGLVVQRGHKGVLLRQPTPQEFAEIYELRLVMEPFFAERAALLATAMQRAMLADLCEQYAALVTRPDLATWLDDDDNYRCLFPLDMQFHATILAAAGNSVAARIFSSGQVLAHMFAWRGTRQAGSMLADRLAVTAGEHAAIYAAIRDRDAVAARERMRQHVLDAIPAVTTRYAASAAAEAEAAEQAAAKRAAAAVRRRKTS